MPKIILVDENDREIGTEEKIKTHEKGLLHRAFSVFIFNSKKELLLQKRALSKYHSAGLWSNTCCSHPKPNEDVLAAAHRRLKEEMGFDCDLEEIGNFIYKKEFENGLIENEYDHLIIGEYSGEPKIDKNEVEEYQWIKLPELAKGLRNNPGKYTYWLKLALPQLNYK